jgi:malonyl-CoA/methylmalonyl-CoA synthetase
LDPGRLVAAIRDESASILFSVPAVYERLVAASEGCGRNREGQPGVGQSPVTRASESSFGSLRLATSGSAPLSTELWAQAAELIGSQPLERYGTTESGLDVSNPYDGPRKPGAVGIPLPGVEMRVVDSAGAELAADADGEVVVRGPQVFAGYWGDDRATRDSFYPQGWFRTGDVGRIDPDDGYLSITGRIKDLIISGGLNVYPKEVELVLEQHPGVERAAVVGVPSERWGEAVVAFVVPAGADVDGNELREHARELLAPYKTPKVVLSTDALPFDSFGKLRRSELAQLAADEVE